MKNFEHFVSIFKSAVIYANAASVNCGGHESVQGVQKCTGLETWDLDGLTYLLRIFCC